MTRNSEIDSFGDVPNLLGRVADLERELATAKTHKAELIEALKGTIWLFEPSSLNRQEMDQLAYVRNLLANINK